MKTLSTSILTAFCLLLPAAASSQESHGAASGEEEQSPSLLAVKDDVQGEHAGTRQRPKIERKGKGRDGQYMVDEEGRRFRVAFPFYQRISLEGNTGVVPMGSARAPGHFGARVRADLTLSLDFSEDEVWWRMRHTILDTNISRYGEASHARLTGAIIDARYLRHDLSTFITVPSANDFRLPGNFDIAVDYRLGAYDLKFGDSDVTFEEFEVFELAILMDFIRDESYRHRFAVGLASWYHAMPADIWRHEISPLAAGKILYGWDQRDGLFRVYTEAVCGAAIAVTADPNATPDWGWRCGSMLTSEWVPFTISDSPVSIPLEVRVDVPLEDPSAVDVQATLGLRISRSLD